MEAQEWEPRVNGCPREVQRDLGRGIAGELGVPPAWVAVCGSGLPQWWLRLSYPWTWRWKLSRSTRPMLLRIKATAVCSVVTRRWSYALRLRIRQRFQAHREEWDETTSEAWSAVGHDGHHRRLRTFGFRGEGPTVAGAFPTAPAGPSLGARPTFIRHTRWAIGPSASRPA